MGNGNGDTLILKESDRKRLDDIVFQMQGNKESDDNIKFVVDDFKSKYGVKKKEPPSGLGSLVAGVVSSVGAKKEQSQTVLEGVGKSYSKQPIQQLPKEEDDFVLDENDPVKSFNQNILKSTRKFEQPKAESTAQKSLSPANQIEKQKSQIDDGKILPYQATEAYEQIKDKAFPTTREARKWIYDKGGIDPENETDVLAGKVVQDYDNVKSLISKHNGNLSDAAVEYFKDISPQLKLVVEKGGQVPHIMKGELLLQFLNNKNVRELSTESREFNTAFLQEKANLLNNYPDLRAKHIIQQIAQGREDYDYNNPFLNLVGAKSSDTVVDNLVMRGQMSELDKRFYEENVRPLIKLNATSIPTSGLIENLFQSAASGVEAIPKGIYRGTARDLITSPEQRAEGALEEQSAEIGFKPKGIVNKISHATGNLAGFLVPMIGGAKVLGAANIMKNPVAANQLMMGLTFYDDLHKEAERQMPNNPELAHILALTQSVIFAKINKVLPNLSKSLSKEVQPAVKEMLEKLQTEKISGAVAQESIVKSVLGKIKEVGGDTIKGATEMSLATGINDALTGVFTGKYDADAAIQNIAHTAESMLLGLPMLKMLPMHKATMADMYDEIANRPEYYKQQIEKQSQLDPEFAKEAPQLLENLEILTKTKEALAERDDLNPEQKKKFQLLELNNAVLEQKKKAIPSKALQEKIQKEQTAIEIDMQRIVDPEMGNKKFVEEMYNEELLPKGSRMMLEDAEGKFAPNKVGAYLKLIAQQANNLDENWKPHEGKAPDMSETPPQIVEIANERWKKEIDKAKPKEEKHAENITEEFATEPVGEGEKGEAITEEELRNGEEIVSIDDAETRLSNGERIFALHEMGDEPHEIRNVGDLKGYTPDQLISVPRKTDPFAKQPEQQPSTEKNIEDKKEGIEKRRQEEYKNNDIPKWLAEGDRINEQIENQKGNVEWAKQPGNEEYLKRHEDTLDQLESIKASIDKINAKYDAELAELEKPSKAQPSTVSEVKSTKDVGRVFDRLLKDEAETEDYGIHGLLADWGAEYNPDNGKLHFEDTRSGTGKWGIGKKDFINWILSGDAAQEIPSAKDYIDKVRNIVLEEIGAKEKQISNETIPPENIPDKQSNIPPEKEIKPKTEATETSQAAEGAKEPPVEPPPMQKGSVFIERPSTELSHRGLQNVANEFSLPDVKTRDRKSDVQLRQDARETAEGWAEKGEYVERIEGLVKKAETGEILTDKERVILERHLANLSAELRNITDKKSTEFDQKLAEIHRLKKAGEQTRSEAGAALRIMGGGSAPHPIEDYADAMVAKAEAIGSDVLTEKQKADVEAQLTIYEERAKAAEQKVVQMQQRMSELEAEKSLKSESVKIKKESGKKKTKEDYQKERQQFKDELREAVEEHKKWLADQGIKQAGIGGIVLTPKMIKVIGKIVKSHVSEIGDNLKEVTKKVFEEIKDLFPGITDKDVHDVISGAYAQPKPTRTQLAIDLRSIQDEAKLINKLEALMRGEEPKSEKKKTERNRQITDLQNKIKEYRKGVFGLPDIEAIKKKNLDKEKEIRERLAKGDFEEKPKPASIFDNPELRKKYPKEYNEMLDAIVAKEDAMHDFDIALLKDAESKMTLKEKTGDYAKKFIATTKALKSGIDFSGVFVQNVVAIISHPRTASRAIPRMFSHTASEKRFNRWLAALHNNKPLWELMEKSGLDVTEPKSLKAEKKEEIFDNNQLNRSFKIWGKEYNIGKYITKPFERAFTSIGNSMRVELFLREAQRLYDEGKTIDTHEKDFQDIARVFNTETGRGGLHENVQKAREIVTAGIWSPKLVASRLNMLGLSDLASPFTGKGYYSGLSPRARAIAVKDVTKFIGTGFATMILFGAMGYGVDLDPESPTFGTIKIGNKRINVFDGMSKYVRTIAQFVKGKKRVEGIEKPAKRGETVMKFFRGSTTPAAGVAWDVITGKDYMNRPITWGGELKQLAAPMSSSGMVESIKKDGVVGIAWGLGQILGLNITDERDFDEVRVPETILHNGKKIGLSGEAKEEFGKLVTENGDKYLTRLHTLKDYINADNDKKIKLDDMAKRQAVSDAEEVIKKKYPEFFPRQTIEEKRTKKVEERERKLIKRAISQ